VGSVFFYQVEFIPDINVVTGKEEKCDILTFVPGKATNRYKCEAFVPVGLDQAPTSFCERTFVPIDGSGSNRAKYLVQMKNQT
jgi:hypothetical protein